MERNQEYLANDKAAKNEDLFAFGLKTVLRKEMVHMTYIRFCFKTLRAFCLTMF